MIEFKNRIVQLGFGAVGKSFFEKISKEIKFNKEDYFVISRDKLEYTFFLELGGKLGNFIVTDINRKNYKINEDCNINKYPIVLHHGNNPGLVSHFVKAGLDYIVRNQFKKDIKLNALLEAKRFNEIAKELGLKEIHVNDNDYQDVKDIFDEEKLYSTWSVDSFFFEMLSEATVNIGTEEKINYEINRGNWRKMFLTSSREIYIKNYVENFLKNI